MGELNKKVLVLYYSQSGQLGQIADSFVQPFKQAGATVETHHLKPVNDFEFPWTSARFFDAMPESVLARPVALQPFTLQHTAYDLVVFAYQPWYLSVSIPANSIITHPQIQQVIKNTPVVTLIGARNMWLNAQEKLKAVLKQSGAKLVGNIALVDNNHNLISVVTILYWMLSGKKDKYLGIFPKPGVADEDIAHTQTYGQLALPYLQSGNWQGFQQQLVSSRATVVKPDLMFVEERAGKLFNIWANLIIKRKNRAVWLTVFKYYLLFALFIVAPVVLTVNALLFRPFMGKSIQRKTLYYQGV